MGYLRGIISVCSRRGASQNRSSQRGGLLLYPEPLTSWPRCKLGIIVRSKTRACFGSICWYGVFSDDFFSLNPEGTFIVFLPGIRREYARTSMPTRGQTFAGYSNFRTHEIKQKILRRLQAQNYSTLFVKRTEGSMQLHHDAAIRARQIPKCRPGYPNLPALVSQKLGVFKRLPILGIQTHHYLFRWCTWTLQHPNNRSPESVHKVSVRSLTSSKLG